MVSFSEPSQGCRRHKTTCAKEDNGRGKLGADEIEGGQLLFQHVFYPQQNLYVAIIKIKSSD